VANQSEPNFLDIDDQSFVRSSSFSKNNHYGGPNTHTAATGLLEIDITAYEAT
jgi:hypothetical protein